MKYLSILEELFSSDSFFFALIGFVAATVIGIRMKSAKKNIIGFCTGLIVYVIAEIMPNIIKALLWVLLKAKCGISVYVRNYCILKK